MGWQTSTSSATRLSPSPSTRRLRSLYAQTNSTPTPIHGTMAKLRSSDPPVPAFGTCCHDLLEQFGESALVAAKSAFPDLDKDAVGLKSLVLRERAKYGPAEPLNFVAYSGGLTVAFNAALFLQSMGIAIDNV